MRVLRSFLLAGIALPVLHAQNDWPSWGRDPGNQRFSPLKQINTSNVSKLVPAWQYQMKKEGQPFRASQSTPLVVGGVMYLSFPFYRVVALEPETGKVLWEYTARGDYDSPEHRTHFNGLGSMRGLAYWRGDKLTPPQIVFGTEDGELYSLNAKTGKPNPGFGNEGIVNLKTPDVMNGFPNMHYGVSSAVTVFKNLVFTGTHNADEAGSKGPSGDVRAWDLRTGQLVWTFHTVPRLGEVGNEAWPGDSWKNVSGANVWTFFTLDEKRGILYMPLGSVQNDYYGIDRPGNNLFANSIVAVDAETGKLKWYFQAVHHDLWDFDMPVPPILFDVVKEGKRIPAVGVMTKMPLLFIFDRVTGKPIYGVEERPVPQGDLPREYYSPTQPFPVKPPPLGRLSFTMDDIAKVTPEHEAACRELLLKEDGGRNRGPYTPPSEKGALVMPAPGGGAEFTGGTFDPNLGYYIINTADTGQISVIERRGVDLDTLPADRKPRFTGPPESPLLYFHPLGPPVAVKGWPCWQPPWSRLTAVNVNTGDIAWQIPFGTVEGAPAGMATGGTTSHVGGPTATAGGLIFIGAATDRLFRAFATKTGQELWSVKTEELIRGANPITYMGKDGKQYVAVAAGTTLLTYKLP
jgi:quinoprotein glucose dehydrogenase